jgi:phosphopantetheine--protein transferase-like protein
MDMQQAKIIIAHFLKKKVEDITEDTVMDNTVVPSSLLLHRMYAALADKGYIVDDPASIITFKEFSNASVGSISAPHKDSVTDNNKIDSVSDNNIFTSTSASEAKEDIKEENNNIDRVDDENILSIGIDIEEISSFEPVDNYMEDNFYKNNFSQEEITYCMSKVNPVESFAGLFSLKEAIIKADNSFKKIKFNKINITHSDDRKPMFDGFALSLSHSKNNAVAVAHRINYEKNQSLSNEDLKKLVNQEIKNIARLPIMITMVSLIFIVSYFFLV